MQGVHCYGPSITHEVSREVWSWELLSGKGRLSDLPPPTGTSTHSSHSALSSLQLHPSIQPSFHPSIIVLLLLLCASQADFSPVQWPTRTAQPWPTVWLTTAPRTRDSAPTTPSRCRPSRRRTPGTNGARRWIFSCQSLDSRWIWGTFGGSRTFVIRTAAVSWA